MLAVIGVVSWSTGAAASEGCGGLTGVTPLARYRAWIIDQAVKMGAALLPSRTPILPPEVRQRGDAR